MEPNFEIDADRPLLEQFEERAMVDDEARDWLFTQIYANPDVMSLLCGLRLLPEVVAETDEVWRKVIPTEYWPRLDGRQVITAGFGAGPGCIGQKAEHFDPPIALDQGLIWLERWRNTFRKGRLLLDDGATLRFDPLGFTGYDGQGLPHAHKRTIRPHGPIRDRD